MKNETRALLKFLLSHVAAICAIFLMVLWVLDYYNPLIKLLHRKITIPVILVGFISLLLLCLLTEVEFIYRKTPIKR